MNNIYKLAGTLNLEMRRQESIARNLAATTLPGYRAEYLTSAATFQEELDGALGEQHRAAGPDAGTRIVDFSQGPLEKTGRSLDFAINGDGFFEVTTAEGKPLYTRNGSFELTPAGTLVTRDGYTVAGAGGPINAGTDGGLDGLFINKDGELVLPSANGSETLGRIRVVRIEEPTKLQRTTAGYFSLRDEDLALARDADPEAHTLLNRCLEGANISPVREMANMIQSMREYEMANKVIKMQDELSRTEREQLTA